MATGNMALAQSVAPRESEVVPALAALPQPVDPTHSVHQTPKEVSTPTTAAAAKVTATEKPKDYVITITADAVLEKACKFFHHLLTKAEDPRKMAILIEEYMDAMVSCSALHGFYTCVMLVLLISHVPLGRG